MCPKDERIEAWNRLARDLPLDRLDRMTETVPLADVPSLAPRILNGAVRGRVVVAVAIRAGSYRSGVSHRDDFDRPGVS